MALVLSLALAAAAPIAQDTGDPYRLVNPKAIELFEREPALMRWALVRFDSDGNGQLSIFEADHAAQAFSRIADSDGDGRVSVDEFRAARDSVAGTIARLR